MQSDYSGQGVNWILTGRSDMCSPVKRSLSKWWTETRLAAWSSCNLLHVIWWGVGFDRLPITCDIREGKREIRIFIGFRKNGETDFLPKCCTVHLFNCVSVDTSFQKSKIKVHKKKSYKNSQACSGLASSSVAQDQEHLFSWLVFIYIWKVFLQFFISVFFQGF